MYLTGKNIKNIDILGAFMRCPFGDTIKECPFIKYHNLTDPVKQIEAFHQLTETDIQSLMEFHTNCVRERCEKEKYPEYSIEL